MLPPQSTRRHFLAGAGQSVIGASIAGCSALQPKAAETAEKPLVPKLGSQRLSLPQLQAWQELGYGMFIHFGMSTFLGAEAPEQRAPMSTYNPDRLDVDQWISVARDAGMKYAVLTAKHTSGHCLWPSRHTDYTVANSGNRTDVLERFVNACHKRGVKPGFYYCSWDNIHRFGSRTHSDKDEGFGVYVKQPDFTRLRNGMVVHPDKPEYLCAYTTSLYQDFVTAQMTELLTQYGPMAEVWIDIPGVLGQGYRAFLYEHITALQPDTLVVANHGLNDGTDFRTAYVWPCDGISLEQTPPPPSSRNHSQTIRGKDYYLVTECCATCGQRWFHTPDDAPRPDNELAELYTACRKANANLLLNIPPNQHGLIEDSYIQALARLAQTVL